MERAFSADWIVALLASLATAVVVTTGWLVITGDLLDAGIWRGVLSVAHVSLSLFGPGAFLGSALGVLAARRYGAIHPWYAGWLVGMIVGVGILWVEVNMFGASL